MEHQTTQPKPRRRRGPLHSLQALSELHVPFLEMVKWRPGLAWTNCGPPWCVSGTRARRAGTWLGGASSRADEVLRSLCCIRLSVHTILQLASIEDLAQTIARQIPTSSPKFPSPLACPLVPFRLGRLGLTTRGRLQLTRFRPFSLSKVIQGTRQLQGHVWFYRAKLRQ